MLSKLLQGHFAVRLAVAVLLLQAIRWIPVSVYAGTPSAPYRSRFATPVPPTLPDDIVAPPAGQAPTLTDAGYTVAPILFVPNDLTPNPLYLRFIDKQMQLVQTWYGWQLRDRTFTLDPARIIVGNHPLSHYYGECWFPETGCEWGLQLWNNIFADLETLGYPSSTNRIVGVFIQNDTAGGPALGGGNRFMVDIPGDANSITGDCLEPGCSMSIHKGGVAHELGHALGLPHPVDDPEGSPGKSVMGWGFYGFPQVTFVDTISNPERSTLTPNPFLNRNLLLRNGSFEDCLDRWQVSISTALTCSDVRHSGLLSLRHSSNAGESYQVHQTVPVTAGQTYDFSGWLDVTNHSGNFRLRLQVVALSGSGAALSTFTAGEYTTTTAEWVRVGASMLMPAGTANARVQMVVDNLTGTVYVDDLDFHLAQIPPPIPLPLYHTNGVSVPSLRPTLRWDEVTSSTAYRLQLSSDSGFSSPVISVTIAAPFYTTQVDLVQNQGYYWRVKALNGVGESDWSNAWRFVPRLGGDYRDDEFETETLNSAWSWIREDQSHWWFGGPPGSHGRGYFAIKTQAGDLNGGRNDAKNLLLRPAPPGNFTVSTLLKFQPEPRFNNQQAGLLIYQDDNNYLKLVRAYRDGSYVLLQAEVDSIASEFSVRALRYLPLNITRDGNLYTGYYSIDGVTWKPVGPSVFANWPTPKIGLAAFSVSDVAPVDAYFDWFRVSPDVSPTFTPTASLEPVTTTVSAGEVFTLELRISVGNQPIDNVDASVQFSSTHLAVVDASGTETTTVVPGSTLPDILLNEVNNATGRIRYSAGKLTGSPPTGEFLLAHIPFRAKAQTSPQGVRVTCDGTDAFFQGNSVLQQCEGAIVIVTQQCITPGSPALISPSDNITTTNNTPTLDWTDTSNANEYQLQVDNIGDFSSPEIDIRTAASNYTPPSALSDGKYYWRVRGHNTGGGCDIYGSWSGIWSVRIGTVWNTYDDYGSTQGTRNWYYQYWDGTTHRDMVWGTNAYNLTSWYAPDDRWTLQNQAALRPSRYDAERVWMSPVTGQIRIVGRFGRYTTRGDGQQVSIWKGATQLWTRTLPDLSSAVFDLTTGIAVGDRIYFRANKRGDDLYDDVDIRATITIVPPQANVPSIALAPSTTAVGVGQVFTLAITIDCGTTSIDGAQAFLNFDPNYLVVVDSSGITATTIITGSAFNTHLINTADNALGRIDYVDGQLTGAPLTGTFTLATVRFKAKQATASTATTFSFALPRQTRLTLGGNNVLNSHTNATVTINAGVLLPGRVNLQGRATPPAPAWSIPITVQLFAPASPVARYVFPTTTSQSGYFDIGPVVGGTYSVTVKNRHTLSVIRRNVSLVADMPRVDFCTLTEGDANNDDAVDITDFSVLRTCFFKPGSQCTIGWADFNEDGFVDINDFSLLRTNFLRPAPVACPTVSMTSPAQAGAVTLSLEPARALSSEDGVTMVKVIVDASGQPVDGAQVFLEFDPIVLAVVDTTGTVTDRIEPGIAFDTHLVNAVDNAAGHIAYAGGVLSGSPVSGRFTLATIYFKALTHPAYSQIRFVFVAGRQTRITYQGSNVLGTWANGVVTTLPPRAYLPLARR